MQKHFFFITFLHLFCVSLFGQQYKATIKQYTEKDGLSSNEVLGVTKDIRGVIWVATKYGLNRFDGKTFKVFTTQNGLYSNYIDQMFVDGDNIWLFYGEVSSNKQSIKNIDIFNIYTHQVTPLSNYFEQQLPFSWRDVEKCDIMGRAVLFRCANNQHFTYKHSQGFEQLQIPTNERLEYISHLGHFWFSRQQADSFYIVKKDKQGIEIGTSIAFFNPTRTTVIRVLFENQAGLACIAICDRCGIAKEFVYRILVSNELQIKHKFVAKNLEAAHINISYIDALNCMWLASEDFAAIYNVEGQETFSAKNILKDANSMFREPLVDGSTVWQCSHTGLYRVELAINYFYHHFPTRQFRNIARVEENLYFNSEKEIIETNNVLVPQYQIPCFGLSGTKAADGSLWIANFNYLYKYAPQTKQLKKYFIPCHEPWGMYEDTEGGVWLSQSGLIRYNPITKQYIEVNYNGFNELRRNTVYHFFPLNSAEMLLCTTSGIYKMDMSSKTIVARYSSESPQPFQLPANDVRHLYFDKKENIFWVATTQNGLIRWNPSTNEFKTFIFHKGIANVIHSVYADDFGFLWLSTEGGIIQFQKETHQFKIYTIKDGLPTNEFNRISHFQDRDGTLYFGSVNGVVSFHPQPFRTLFYEKEEGTPFVVEVGQYLGESNRVEDVTADFEQQKRIYLHPDDRFFTLTIGLKEYEQADAATYFYKLKNQQADEWVEVSNNKITLGRLPYGNQTLLVRTLLVNGQFAEKILEIPIYVKRPFYITWWFALLVAFLLGSLVYWRIREVQQRNIILEEEVRQRTQIIAKQTTELQQLDELKSRFFANISHELRTPITLILNPLSHLLNYKNWEQDKQKLLLTAQKNSQKLLRLVNEILDLTKLETASLQLENSEIELLIFIRRIVAEFESLAMRNGIILSIEHTIAEKIIMCTDVKKVETILYNFITNALKFTLKNGYIKIIVTIQNLDIQFEVYDTGRGIAAEDLPHIFNRFYQSKTNSTNEGGSGLGLALSRELAQLLRGEIWAVSEWGKGSSFFFKLPNSISAKKEGNKEETFALETSNLVIQAVENEAFIQKLSEEKVKWLTTITAPQPDKYKILLVEDNLDLQDYVLSRLSSSYNMSVSSNGKEAIDYLESLDELEMLPDLIISDVMMPNIDGYQLLSLLKGTAKYRKIPVIMLTARAGLDDKLKALRIGVDDYLTKPFVEAELSARIENLLQNANIRKQTLQEQSVVVSNEVSENTAIMTSDWLKEVEKIIYENMSKSDFSIESVSEKLGISRQTLNLHIKKEVGMTAVQYLQQVRLDYAQKLLENKTIQSVKTAAETIGMTDVRYFSLLFKKRFGRLPSEYLG